MKEQANEIPRIQTKKNHHQNKAKGYLNFEEPMKKAYIGFKNDCP